MPAFVTHELFGSRVFRELDPEIRRLLNCHPSPFFWGLQGPDLLFFRDAVRGKSALPRYGSRMHQEKTGELFQALCKAVSGKRGSPSYETRLSYFIGFACHYALDAGAHPYIYFFQAETAKRLPEKYHKGIHNRLESDIDSELYRMKRGRPVSQYRPASRLLGNMVEYGTIARLYVHVLSEVYQIQVSAADIRKCFREAYRMLELALDPFQGGTEKAAMLYEALAGKPNTLSAHIRKSRAEGDPLNLAHQSWHNPEEPDQPDSRSFPELFEDAVKPAVKLAETIYHHVQAGEDWAPLGMPSFDRGRGKGHIQGE